MIFNNYISEPSVQTDCTLLFRHIDEYMENDVYLSHEHNEQSNSDCTYWKLHKYTVIQDGEYINGSKLWESIKTLEGKHKKTKFNRFLQLKPAQLLERQLQKSNPHLELHKKPVINKKQPQFSGTYVHYTVVPVLVTYLNTDYAEMITDFVRGLIKLYKSKRLLDSPHECSITEVTTFNRLVQSH